ncbi:hypothetical protein [Synechococcus sp. CS-1328]|uniref:hypothetical protein n=1 Tax=Synechococcus sp. CS-1328 TaxID=2847976 RepID=UPI00223AEEFC|nr:hypothetical protein [Synechococcus sp. CS-1328]MCT0225928.1 hypothetical protein [Synechococcus sp. CS-1328]
MIRHLLPLICISTALLASAVPAQAIVYVFNSAQVSYTSTSGFLSGCNPFGGFLGLIGSPCTGTATITGQFDISSGSIASSSVFFNATGGDTADFTFTNVGTYTPAANLLTFSTGSVSLNLSLAGAITETPFQTIALSTPGNYTNPANSGLSPDLRTFTSVSGSIRAVPSPFLALLLLPIGSLALLRRRVLTRLATK